MHATKLKPRKRRRNALRSQRLICRVDSTGITYTAAAGGTVISSVGYTYDAVGRRVSTTNQVNPPAYDSTSTYNANNQLVTWTGAGGTGNLTYDANGNLVSDWA